MYKGETFSLPVFQATSQTRRIFTFDLKVSVLVMAGQWNPKYIKQKIDNKSDKTKNTPSNNSFLISSIPLPKSEQNNI